MPAAIGALFRTEYPIEPPGPGANPAEARIRTVCPRRAVDGVALYEAAKAAKAAHQAVPAKPALDATARPEAAAALTAFLQWVDTTWGTIGSDEPPAWDPARLDYSATIFAGDLTLETVPDSEAALDWYAFDLLTGTPPTITPNLTSVIPGHVRFRGMPNARWWDFETSKTDFGAILPDPRDLAKLLFADFLLIHGDDWYLARLDVPVGSLCWIDSLSVTDVFGVTQPIPRADAAPGTGWTLFSTTERSSGASVPFLVVPSSATAAQQASGPLEEVHLLRDETADMAWAIEHVVEDPTGTPQLESPPPSSPPPTGAPAPLAYQLATPLPASWFPLLPVAAPAGGMALAVGTVDGGPRAPSGRLVRRLADAGLQLPEAEVSRSGLRLQRVACRTRTFDGNARFWIARRKQIGTGEASSGLRYDEARSVES